MNLGWQEQVYIPEWTGLMGCKTRKREGCRAQEECHNAAKINVFSGKLFFLSTFSSFAQVVRLAKEGTMSTTAMARFRLDV